MLVNHSSLRSRQKVLFTNCRFLLLSINQMVTMEYTDVHRALVQSMMSLGIVELSVAQDIFARIVKMCKLTYKIASSL